jgi:hypothetical protein
MSRESIPPTTTRDVAILVAGTVGLLLLLNALIPSIEVRANRGYWLLERKWAMLSDLSRPVDTLVLGDSSGNQAAMPAVLAKHLGGRAINLCTFGDMTAAGDAWMLEEYLRRFGPPRHVVSIHVHDVWERSLNLTNLAQIPRPWGFWDQHQPRVASSLDERWSVAVRRYVPLYARTWSLIQLMHSPVRILRSDFRLEPDGFMPVTVQSDLTAQTQGYLKHVRTQRFFLSDINRHALQRMIQLSNQHGFPLYLANGPLYRPLYDDPDFRRYLDEMNRELAALAATGRQVYPVLAKPMLFEANHLESVDHTNTAGAPIYTAGLAQAISQAPAAGR